MLQKTLDANEPLLHYKGRLVAHGFRRYPGYDYNECSAPLVDLHLLHLLLSIRTANNADKSHVEVETAFQEAELGQEIWLSLPAAFGKDTRKMVVDINTPAGNVQGFAEDCTD